MAFAGIPATYVHYSTGATLVLYGPNGPLTPTANEKLGYAEDRVMIDERPIWEDIKNDAFGGQAGVPSDVQYLGSIAYVTCTLNRFVEANLRALSRIEYPAAAPTPGPTVDGTLPPMGHFVRQDTMYDTLWLVNAKYTLKYQRAFLRQGRRFNIGVRHQQFMLMFECHITDPCDMELFTYQDPLDPCSSS